MKDYFLLAHSNHLARLVVYFSIEHQIPAETSSIQMILMGTRYAGDDNDSYFDDLLLRIWQNQTCFGILGDLNNDTMVNILDVIILVNHILSPAAVELDGSDLNNDGIENILDIIILVNIILNN